MAGLGSHKINNKKENENFIVSNQISSRLNGKLFSARSPWRLFNDAKRQCSVHNTRDQMLVYMRVVYPEILTFAGEALSSSVCVCVHDSTCGGNTRVKYNNYTSSSSK